MTAKDTFRPQVGVPEALTPELRRIVAPNAGPMTYTGTNTYLVGHADLAVIDPGPDNAAHLQAILTSCNGAPIRAIIVTHAHLDHSPLARSLAKASGAPVYAYGPADAGRSTVMSALVADGFEGGGEGIDTGFCPDETVADGDRITGTDWALDVIHTPGHLGNHISLGWETVCFTGDHVMGWASSLVSPPDGDLTDFMASCARLRAQNWDTFYPGHGAPVPNPAERLDWLIQHRRAREAAILEALAQSPGTAQALARQIYTDTAPALLPAATRNVLAHLVDLTGKAHVAPQGPLRADAVFVRV